ncbi:MAG: D-glycero-beta-D-manno-heptose-7-phosphate kinase [Bacteroidetes bacterium]|nr:D-glycero-beta-D-manno-heptose-7-phosphate kinase [Bacteroidota bacterium]
MTKTLEAFSKVKALIIGDSMLDCYIMGKVDRISPEAPVPVLLIHEKQNRLGGAANVAANIKALGAIPLLISITGDDTEAEIFKSLLDKEGIESNLLITDPSRKTTCKTRVLSNNRQMMRLDNEDLQTVSSATEDIILERIKTILENDNPQVCILQDYNKGMLSERIIRETTMLCLHNNIPVAVDPKKNNFFAYQLCTLFKPNLRELNENLQMEIPSGDIKKLNAAIDILQKQLHNGITLVTLSEHGVYLKSGEKTIQLPAHIRNVADVSGAGDTVISIASLCLAIKTSLETLAALSNLAGGIVCEYPGVVSIDKKVLIREAEKKLS